MRKYLYVLCSAVLIMTGCQKKAAYDQPLGLFSEYNKLGSGGNVTDIPVYSNTDWEMRADRVANWCSVDRFSGSGCGRVKFSYETNYGRSRRVILIFTAGDVTRSINMYQEGGLSDSEVELTISEDSLFPSPDGQTYTVPFNTNLVYNLDEIYLSFRYPAGETPATPWIVLNSVTADQIVFTVAPNNTGVVRQANVRVAHTDAGSLKSTVGDTLESGNKLTITQASL